MATITQTETCELVNTELHEEPFLSEVGEDPETVTELADRDMNDTRIYAAQNNTPFPKSPLALSPELAQEYERGKVAGSTLQRLGCEACVLAPVCPIRELLVQTKEAGSLSELVYMLDSAPDWVKKARTQRTFETTLTPATLEDYTALLAGIINIETDPLSVSDTPGLRDIKTINPDAQLPGQVLYGPDKDSKSGVEVYDAREYITGFNGTQMDAKSEINVLGKFASLCVNEEAPGTPMVVSAQGEISRPITAWRNKDGRLFEIRMNGKNRLYYLVLPNSPQSGRARVVLIGGHGDSSTEQDIFIDAIC